MDLVLEWCSMCEDWFVRCPKCGNNSCNGGYGKLEDGTDCDICPLCYDYLEEVTHWRNRMAQ